ncbi:MAG: lytic transglycosylase domain-containing protein [Myxococcota bacterium]
MSRSVAIVAIGAGLICSLVSGHARAELYTFTDGDGVIHFTNLPNDPRYRRHTVNGKQNSFTWEDNLGQLRTIHRVNIGKYDALIIEAARYYTLPPALVKAVAAVESSFEPSAVSHAGAQGLMQLIPSTAIAMQVRDPFMPRDNVYGGTRYLRILANRFGGDVRLTLAAYNAGPTAVSKAGGVPDNPETKRYVPRVLRLYRYYLSTMVCGKLEGIERCRLPTDSAPASDKSTSGEP